MEAYLFKINTYILNERSVKMKELKVCIKRSPSDFISGEIPVSAISGVKWDNISGGVKRNQSGYSLYGYIDYELTKNCEMFWNANYGNNEAKICIPASANQGEYKEGYKYLCKIAGGKPSGTIKSNRPEGGKPCTVRILEELEKQGEMTRKNLRKIICDEGYQIKTFRNTIYYLKRQKRISVIGEGTSPNQKIKKS